MHFGFPPLPRRSLDEQRSMPHDSSHGASCGCTPEEKQQLEGTLDFLYSKIDRDNVIALNSAPAQPAKNCIKPWDRREDESEVRSSY